MRALSHHFRLDGDTTRQLQTFASELAQRARDLEAGRLIGETSGARSPSVSNLGRRLHLGHQFQARLSSSGKATFQAEGSG
jgi:hypothetical protein